ncbi:MAG: DNA mismatch repair protein MutS [Flavobacteriia bacterium]|nr:MAG: DNA mismatch repair protein MutS [Flavobacteriia bacterium]
MNWILGILLLVIAVYFHYKHSQKKRLKNLNILLKKNWGKPKEGEYYNFDLIERYFTNSLNKKIAFHIISDMTENDLDINELFKFIDRTSSKIGQQYLYYKLRTIENKEKLKEFDKLIELFKNDNELRLQSQIVLSQLNSYNSYDLEKLIHNLDIKKPNYTKYLIPLSLTAIISIFLGFFYPIFFLVLIPVFSLNIIFHFKNKDNIYYYVSAVNQLSLALSVSKNLASFPEIRHYFTDFSFIKQIDKIELKTKFIGFEKHLVNEFAALAWYVAELIKIQFNIESIIFYRFIDDIIQKNKSIDTLFQFIGKIDAAISVASVKSGEYQTCQPEFNTKNIISVAEISHPIIKECITNDIELINKSLLLTGSNMSGKTTFIRTIAINSILAQTLHFSFAKEFSLPFYKVYSSIRITDDLLDDTSYYLKEVLTIKELIEASNDPEPCLFVLDEIFKGTNTIERISGGKAILSYLNKGNNFVFVSTHDVELTDLLKDENFELYHFTEKIENNEMFFDHKLKKGKLKTRNAIKILELYDYPDEIIADARKTEKDNFC